MQSKLPKRAGLLAILVLVSSLQIKSINYAAEPEYLLAGFVKQQLIISATLECVNFTVYIAQTQQQRSQGLMHVQSMPMNEGMIFLYPEPSPIYMWMKNTPMSLDMLFIATDGTITSIAANTTPFSEEVIGSGIDVNSVVELNAGAAEYFGIDAGNRIIYLAGQLFAGF